MDVSGMTGMRWMRLLCLCAVFCNVLIATADTQTVSDDTIAPLSVLVPEGADNTTYKFHMAHFGQIPYQEVYSGIRIISIDASCQCGDVPCNTGCGDFSLASPATCQLSDVGRAATAPDNGAMILVEESGGDLGSGGVGCLRSIRAMNVAKAGAQGVLIVAAEGTADADLVPPSVVKFSETAQQEALYLQHVNIPVGIMTYSDANELKALGADGTEVQVQIDFTSLFPQADTVTISIWHNTGDDCGAPCFYLHEFLKEMADVATRLAPGHPISIEPRFTYDTCSAATSEECIMSCTNNGRYCHMKLENEQLWGRLIAEENIRQACLFNVLGAQEDADVRSFWTYKRWFQDNCTNDKQTFNYICSSSAFNRTLEGPNVLGDWETCWQFVGADVDVNLPIAQRDVDGMQEQMISEGLLATVVINDQKFRGALDAAHVLKAACSALSPDVLTGAAAPICTAYTHGHCAPYSVGDRECGSEVNEQLHRTICKETDENTAGYTCECSAGYANITRDDSTTECIDRNECIEFDTLCSRNDNTRNICHNLDGSFECSFDTVNECTVENDFNGCWRETVDTVTVTSCEDLFDSYSDNLANGRPGGELSRCRCQSIAGCWTGGVNDCEQACDDPGTCNPVTHECTVREDFSRGALVAGLGGAVGVAVVVGLLLALLMYRRRQKKNAPQERAAGVVSSYDTFKDGLDADEMERSGATDVKPAPEAKRGGKGVVAAVSASQYAMNAESSTGALDASLQLQEHSLES